MFDEETIKMVYFGQEGVHYTVKPNGQCAYTPEWSTKEKKAEAGLYTFWFHGMTTEKLTMRFGDELETLLPIDAAYERVQPVIHNLVSFPAQATYGADMTSKQEEFAAQAFIGSIDVDKEWDRYVSEWLNAGGQQLLNEMQEYYDANK